MTTNKNTTAFATAASIAVSFLIVLGLLTVSKGGLLGDSFQMMSPRWAYCAALLPFLTGPVLRTRTNLAPLQCILSLCLRTITMTLLIAALMHPVVKQTDPKSTLVVLIDTSQSVSNTQLQQSHTFAKNVLTQKSKDLDVNILLFAETIVVMDNETILQSDSNIFEDLNRGDVTDIESAVAVALSKIPEGRQGRVCILTDGVETNGNIDSITRHPRLDNVIVDAVVTKNRTSNEVLIESLKGPTQINLSESFTLKSSIWASRKTSATAILRQRTKQQILETRTLSLEKGNNIVTFEAKAKAAGPTSYELSLQNIPSDTIKQNNKAVFTTQAVGKPQVLVVDGAMRSSAMNNMHFVRALNEGNMSVTAIASNDFGRQATDLNRYDLIVLSDVASSHFSANTIAALETYLRDQGGGLIYAAGANAINSSPSPLKALERLLPLRFEGQKTREKARVAISLVIDRSGSMQGQKLEAAKASARATAEVLSSFDMLEVIAFDGAAKNVVRMQRASNKFKISEDISRLTAGGGTDIRPALTEAFRNLSATDAKVKHVIVLSDGHAPFTGISNLVQKMADASITISAVGIGDADRSLLELIATQGRGRLYMTDNLSGLPRIFTKETTEAQHNALVENSTHVVVAKSNAVLNGTGVKNSPPIQGFLSTRAKKNSETILKTTTGEPLMTRWTVGLGTVLAWTSDIKNKWSVNWLTWPGFQKFWSQVVRATMKSKRYNNYEMHAVLNNNQMQINVDAIDANNRYLTGLKTPYKVVDAADKSMVHQGMLQEIAPGRYTDSFIPPYQGNFLVTSEHFQGTTKVAETNGTSSFSYPREFAMNNSKPDALINLVSHTNGTLNPTPRNLVTNKNTSAKRYRDAWAPLVFFAMLLFVIETFFKRIRIFES